MYDSSGDIIYVGKARNLSNRVHQYFHSSKNMMPKVAAMVSHIADIEYIVVTNETEAFTLESNLIKEFMPRYNILLKDDKHFPYVRLDIKQDFPRFEIVRKVKNDNAKYFGPYLSSLTLHEAMSTIRDSFPVRHCKKDIKKAIARNERPCLMYHIGKCCAPCSGNISRNEYHKLLDNVSAFLNGQTQPVISMLTDDMNSASDALDFERAAILRDRINVIKQMEQRQRAISVNATERDVFALVRDDVDTIIFALFIRDGKVIGSKEMRMDCSDESEAEIMSAFLKQFYGDSGSIPKEIVVSHTPESENELIEWLKSLRGKSVSIFKPERGEKRQQVEIATKNGYESIKRRRELEHREWERGEGALLRLCELLSLPELPSRIECFDNSHIQGRDTVSSMAVFIDGKAAPSEYRHFRIKQDTNGDDIGAMREVLDRRFTSAVERDVKFSQLPDLLIVDGGIAQLNVALEILQKHNLEYINSIGLAEQNENIIIPYTDEPLSLSRRDPALQLLQRIRDEAHRFAITYHRSLRGKNSLYSLLDEIEGVGPKRKRLLFDAFITIDAIKNADVDALAAVKGVSRPAAQEVYKFFHKDSEQHKETEI